MKKLFLKSLTIVSDVEESANRFIFQKTNLILSKDNSVGKSTLIDMIFWTLGCDVSFKPEWQSADVKSLLEISINNHTHMFARIKGNHFYKSADDTEFQKFDKITGDFTRIVLSVFGLPYLKIFNKQNDLISPTPDYLLSPFYIDQSQWNSDFFGNIKGKYISKRHYDNILKLYIGHIDIDYFERILEIDSKNKEINSLKSEFEDIESSKTTINKIYNITENDERYLPLIMEKDFEKVLLLIEEKSRTLLPKKYSISSEINELQNERLFYKSQLSVVKTAYEESEKDYIEAVENQDMEITCPICGVEHQNSIGARAQILVDKTESLELFEELKSIIEKIEKKIHLKKKTLFDIVEELNEISHSFSLEKDIEQSNLTIERLASLSVEKRLIDEQENINTNIKSANKSLNKIVMANRVALKDLNTEETNNYFLERFSTIAQTLNVSERSYSNFLSPLSYTKLEFDKGADSARGVLSLYLALWQTIERNQACFFPLFIDTPNQQEQDPRNYPKIVKAIIDNIAKDHQIFICALDNVALTELEEISSIKHLSRPILHKDKYETFKDLLNLV